MQNDKVEKITAAQAMDLRMRVLRPHHPREMCEYAEDNLETTFHLGILQNGKVICNGTFMLQGHEKLKSNHTSYRLRGMATDPDFQQKGLGRKIIMAAEEMLKQKNCDLLWFNARVSAEGFYQKLGYTALPEIFNIDTIGAHKVMYKKL
ncbi:MAG: GNAT family N-acetyltransferase [Pseudobdellovibrio sp.]